jgi:hypothetical protein
LSKSHIMIILFKQDYHLISQKRLNSFNQFVFLRRANWQFIRNYFREMNEGLLYLVNFRPIFLSYHRLNSYLNRRLQSKNPFKKISQYRVFQKNSNQHNFKFTNYVLLHILFVFYLIHTVKCWWRWRNQDHFWCAETVETEGFITIYSW